ncbi:MAG: hypothetical protein GVY14_11510, partial [Spirochaetes bacterium]|nr:hypothetical protein [Spirochaetota bacterium]
MSTRRKTPRLISTILAVFLLAVPLSAQDNGEGDDGGGGGGTVSFFEGDSGGGTSPSTSVGGEVELELRAFPEYDDFD